VACDHQDILFDPDGDLVWKNRGSSPTAVFDIALDVSGSDLRSH
jgi:hypothetical protein